jgi:hypothetical protein
MLSSRIHLKESLDHNSQNVKYKFSNETTQNDNSGSAKGMDF